MSEEAGPIVEQPGPANASDASDVLRDHSRPQDNDHESAIAAEWQRILDMARQQADWPEILALYEAAHATPRLRAFYPYTSMWALGFATEPDVPFDTPQLEFLPATRSGYTIMSSWSAPPLFEGLRLEEAIALAVARIPADLGPYRPRRRSAEPGR
ncbi:DUF6193 family natural product biosynthesis protein [Actinomadura rupiterrae]|uniref:DUF6193 family natural product biosynthesis protein n=1 Tax=Actinomadura rupiterrae TaxID=559627 RepID=UPI0020A47644|nr:DUF6193 family natural product biosynthesis protein [Actinomadura rupiterrae]MCP2341554.1 hypothetical protein [Actinomadura rupiterrae]